MGNCCAKLKLLKICVGMEGLQDASTTEGLTRQVLRAGKLTPLARYTEDARVSTSVAMWTYVLNIIYIIRRYNATYESTFGVNAVLPTQQMDEP